MALATRTRKDQVQCAIRDIISRAVVIIPHEKSHASAV